MAMYPNWLILYIKQIILPMVVMVIIALKILLKFGRDLQRRPEVWIIDPSFYNMFILESLEHGKQQLFNS